jgi:hypothetical protein
MPITVLRWTAEQDFQDARILIRRVADELPMHLASLLDEALAKIDEVENRLADAGLPL